MKSLFFLLLLIEFSVVYLEKESSNNKQDIVLPGVAGVYLIKLFNVLVWMRWFFPVVLYS